MTRSGTHTGARERVLKAIKNGARTHHDVMRRTGLDRTQVDNAIQRLCGEGEIRRRNLGGYEATAAACLLTEVWR
jgi:predicted transcriptional regulator